MMRFGGLAYQGRHCVTAPRDFRLSSPLSYATSLSQNMLSALIGLGNSRGFAGFSPEMTYPSGEPHLPFQVKPLSSVLMDDLKVAHKYGGNDGARDNFWR
jgi:hypothetical protein